MHSTVEKEALALVLTLECFKVYVSSSSTPTVVHTDHSPFVFINQMWNTNQELMRWAVFLQAFSMEVRHVKGWENVLANELLRC